MGGYGASNGGLNNVTLAFLGPETFRPSHNAYMVANARAIAATARAAGNSAIAANFTTIANNLESAIFKCLWDPDLQFFINITPTDRYTPGITSNTPVRGRQEIGLFPFRFGIGLSPEYADPSLRQLFDPEGFQAPFGPTTLDGLSSLNYIIQKPMPGAPTRPIILNIMIIPRTTTM